MKKNKNKIIARTIFSLCFLLYISYWSYQILIVKPKREKTYLSNYRIVEGKFISFNTAISRSYQSKILFEIDGKEYIHKVNFATPCRESDIFSEFKAEELYNFRFPVVVSEISKEFAFPLIRPEEFKTISKPFPDSLNYMYRKYFKCTFWEKMRLDD